jgi:hypothetical protein
MRDAIYSSMPDRGDPRDDNKKKPLRRRRYRRADDLPQPAPAPTIAGAALQCTGSRPACVHPRRVSSGTRAPDRQIWRVTDSRTVRKSDILNYWISEYGPLSPISRERFLRRQEVRRLTRYPDDLVKRAIRFSNLLADALNFAALLNNPLGELPAEPRKTDARAPTQRRDRHRDDRLMHQKIGPIQNYEDDF